MVSLTDWVSRARTDRGIYFADDHDGWQLYDYSDLARRSRRIAYRLQDSGVGKNSVVCLIQPSGPSFVAALFGTWLAGATVCPLAPPTLFDVEADYSARVSRLLASADPSAVITAGPIADQVRRALHKAGFSGHPVVLDSAVADDDNANEIGTAHNVVPQNRDVALLQFTSGSTGTPRGVRVSEANLTANIMMIRDWLKWDQQGCASWLPLHHDMGLIGCLITPVMSQTDLWLLRPDQFVRNPVRWLACFGDGRATLTAAPSFSFAYTTRKVPNSAVHGMDFSGWRAAVVGAEPIDVRSLSGFSTLLRPVGFNPEVFRPSYGLAEATLAVSGLDMNNTPLLVRPRWSALRFGEPVSITSSRRFGTGPEHEQTADWLVGCGCPLLGQQVSIIDAQGKRLPNGNLGEIAVSGPTVADGYYDAATSGSTCFENGLLRSGDAGFLFEGQLFVLGRIGDSLKVRGRSIFVEDLEAKLCAAAGLSRSRFVVMSGGWTATGTVVLLANCRPGKWVRDALRILRTQTGPDLTIHVIVGGPELIHRSTSGKPRRRYMWEELRAGRLGGIVVASDYGPDGEERI
jgi:fatty-acyl-CoA synthase